MMSDQLTRNTIQDEINKTSTNNTDNSDSKKLKNSIYCLNMFERGVQDPCSLGCDYEDEFGFSGLTDNNQKSNDNNKDTNSDNDSGEDSVISNSNIGTINNTSYRSNSTFNFDDNLSYDNTNNSERITPLLEQVCHYETDSLDPLVENVDYNNISAKTSPRVAFKRCSSQVLNSPKFKQLSLNDNADVTNDQNRNFTQNDVIKVNNIIENNIEAGNLYKEPSSSSSSFYSAPIWTNPFSKDKINSCSIGQPRLKKSQTVPFSCLPSILTNESNTNGSSVPQTPSSIRRSRTNSSCYIQQLSRQSLRSGSSNKDIYNLDSTNNTTGRNSRHNSNSNNNSNLVRPKALSHSSCSSILTHLYGLEKYVSSDLDALSTEKNFNSTGDKTSLPKSQFPRSYSNVEPLSDRVSFNTKSRPGVLYSSQNSNSDLSLKSYTPASYDFQSVRRNREKSFIEKSLASSFSQNN